MAFSTSSAGRLIITLLLVLLFSTFCFTQNKVDLVVKTQSASNTARGGETFSYLVTITNTGSAPATDVALLQTSRMHVVSSVPSVGSCRELKESRQIPTPFRCLLGGIKPGATVSITFQVKIVDFDGEAGGEEFSTPSVTTEGEDKLFNKKPLTDSVSNVSREKPGRPSPVIMLIANISVSAEQGEENHENNHAEISVKALPSRNLAPRVQIISPQNEATITRTANRLTKVVFAIKAFDPDGRIEKVIVNTGQFFISIEYPENRYIIDGKSYSIKEVEENREAFKKYLGGEAIKTGKDTYTFVLENPKYGFNQVGVAAYDNGNRVGFAGVNFFVKGDNSVVLKTPGQNEIIKPNTDVVLEAETRINEDKIAKIELIGNQLCCPPPPVMEQISGNGASFVHRYVWKNISKGYYAFQALLTTSSGSYTYSERLHFKVTEKPSVKITSLKNGQIFKLGEDVPIEVEAVDPDGKIETVSISVDGKYDRDFTWRQDKENKSGYLYSLKKGTYKILAKVKDDMEVEAESEPITIVVN